MKLASKLALCMVALFGVVFAAGGYIMIGESFSRSMDSALQRHTAAHLAGADALHRQLADARYGGEQLWDYDYTDMGQALAETVAGDGGTLALLNASKTALFNNLPGGFNKSVQTVILDAPQPGYLCYRFEGRTYLALPSNIEAGNQQLWLISSFDITPLFAERQHQTQTFYRVYAVVLMASTVLGALLAQTMARPLQKLSAASREIAQGAYHQRTGIQRQDEIGEVARHFDEMAASVEEKVQSLELSVRQRQDFVAAFTHELKTPMTAMMGYSALLGQDALAGEEREKALSYIHSQTARLENLSQKLLSLLGISGEELELEPVSLAGVLHTVEAACAAMAQSQLQMPRNTNLWVLADPDLLADLLINLIQNAAQSQPAGGVVQVEAQAQEDSITLLVKDTGRGIPPQELARIEEPFYRVDKSRAMGGGTGLGLALAARIAHAHGTTLAYTSVQGEGTTVSVRLTRCDAQEESL